MRFPTLAAMKAIMASRTAISIGFVVAPSKVRLLIKVRTMPRCGFAFQETMQKTSGPSSGGFRLTSALRFLWGLLG